MDEREQDGCEQQTYTTAQTELFAFPDPSPHKAAHLLRELEWEERFIGIDMNPAAGSRQVYLYSMKEACRFLQDGTAGMGLSTGARGSFSWIDIEAFVRWINDSVGDHALACTLARIATEESIYHDFMLKIGPLMTARYAQLTDILRTQRAREAEVVR